MAADSKNNGRRRTLRNIAIIGSLEFQQLACVNATPQWYMLLDEEIDTTITNLELQLSNPILVKKWSQLERNALQEFLNSVTRLFQEIPWSDENISIKTLVEDNAEMQEIRDAANRCLANFDVHFSLEELIAD